MAVLAGTLITHPVQAKAEARAPRGPAVDVAQVDALPATPRPDEFGGIVSTHIVVRLNLEAYQRVRMVTPDGFGDADPRSRSSERFQTAAESWHVTKMRPLYGEPFADPVLAARYGLDRTYVLEVPRGTDTETMAAAFAALGEDVEFAGFDSIGGVAGGDMAEDRAAGGGAAGGEFIPNDPLFSQQWGMHNTGQTGGLPDADIDAPEAWAIHTGDFGTVTVALVDSGINSHPEYGTNAPPFPNGRIVEGRNTNNPLTPTLTTDACPHGTHVAGIIAATGNNGVGVAGVTWGAYIMPVRVLNGCFGDVTDLIEGIVWAADHGAQVINMPLQYNLTTPATVAALQSAVDYAHDHGAILIAATGVNNFCGPGVVCYPGKATNVIAVSATNNRDLFASFSNYGPQTDLTAPGEDIFSTWTSGGYSVQDGTSHSAAHVSGLAALIKSYAPFRTNDQIAEIIQQTADDLGPLGWDNHFGYGRINAANALILAIGCASDDDCEDNDPCTDNRCDPVEGCRFLDNSAPCDDGNACTTNDTCDGLGGCTDNDFQPSGTTCGSDADTDCTNPDTCNGAGTCLANDEVVGTTCDDGDTCTTNDTCSDGVCGGTPISCDDGDACTTNTCSGGVCVFTNNTEPCDDGDACTTNDTCAGGACVGGTPPNCDDGNICTDESCDPIEGCRRLEVSGPCDDGISCTSNDRCISGSCQGELAFGLGEWRQFTECFSGVGVEVQRGCECSDLDGNGNVDLLDVAEFMRQFDGS